MTTGRRSPRRFFGPASGVRRQRRWHRLAFAGTGLANASQGVLNLLQNLPVTEAEGCTVVRVIHNMRYYPSMTLATEGAQLVSVGIGVVSEESFNAGVVPDPNSNVDEPPGGWMYRDVAMVGQGSSPDWNVPGVMSVDLRAMRKLGRAVLMHVINNDAVEGTAFTVTQVGLIIVLCLQP